MILTYSEILSEIPITNVKVTSKTMMLAMSPERKFYTLATIILATNSKADPSQNKYSRETDI